MAEASSQPHVVATIEPNRWAWNHADLKVDNTGNATAYDILVSFDPPLENGGARRDNEKTPLQTISVLKPGQGLSSYLSEFRPLAGKSFTVTISWRRDPAKNDRETNTYTLNMVDAEGVSRLGASDPLTQIAEEVKKIREDWRPIAKGSNKIQTDVFTSQDRLHERQEREKWFREATQPREESEGNAIEDARVQDMPASQEPSS
jgi:hypothetical protein